MNDYEFYGSFIRDEVKDKPEVIIDKQSSVSGINAIYVYIDNMCYIFEKKKDK